MNSFFFRLTAVLWLSLVFDVCNAHAQSRGFLTTYSDENHSWFATD